MFKKLLAVAVVATVAFISLASPASAADRWGRSSYGSRSNCGSNYGSYNSYGSSRSNQDILFFPQQNQLIIRQDYGSGLSIYSSSPIVQYGADVPLYVPMQRPVNLPSWVRW